MGNLTGFRYKEIVKRLKALGFIFQRQAAGRHEIWYNPVTGRYTTIPNRTGFVEDALAHVRRESGRTQGQPLTVDK